MSDDTLNAVIAFVRRHRFMLLGGLGGLVLAVLFATIGFWYTLLVTALTAGGGALGAYLDARARSAQTQTDFFTQKTHEASGAGIFYSDELEQEEQ